MTPVLDSRQLQAFATLARLGSFTRTAAELSLTQSAVSYSIKALETDLGCALFNRVGKRAQLTASGERLLKRAEPLLQGMRQARDDLAQLNRWGHGRLRVGASTAACQFLLPTVLREFRESFPHCQVRIQQGDTPELLDLLRANQVDLAVTLDPEPAADFVFRRLFRDELRFVIPPMHPWARVRRIEPERISEEVFIVYQKNSYTFRMIHEYFRRQRLTLTDVVELGSLEAMKELARIGLGVAILAPWVARRELAEGLLVARPMGRARLTRTWGVTFLKNRRLSLAEETFTGLCETVAEDWQ
ncbi:MAG: LysR family transcriptional regulator [Puniceicoccaceae bacterium]|nr:MAG: LysR family transcriptional regulator [Puniceicoccaceae bacterium]